MPGTPWVGRLPGVVAQAFAAGVDPGANLPSVARAEYEG